MTSNCNITPIIKESETVKFQDIDLLLRDQQNIDFYNEEEEDSNEDEDFEYNEDEQPKCGCGAPLSPGWECAQCRSNCTTCHRALSLGEVCSRCNINNNVEHSTKSAATSI